MYISVAIYIKNKLATLPFLLDIYATNLSWFSVYFYSFSFCMILQKMSIIFNVQNLSQVDRLRHSYPATFPVKIFVPWPCPALPCPARAGQGRLSITCRALPIIH